MDLCVFFALAEFSYLNFAAGSLSGCISGMDKWASKRGAEALSARDAVNKIRVRAGIPALSSGMSKDSFEKRYRNERRVELAFEEHRFFDVRRWKILK